MNAAASLGTWCLGVVGILRNQLMFHFRYFIEFSWKVDNFFLYGHFDVF